MDEEPGELWGLLPGYASDDDDASPAGADADGDGELAGIAEDRLKDVLGLLGDRWIAKEFLPFEPITQSDAPSPRRPRLAGSWTAADQPTFRIRHIDAPIVLGTLAANGFHETQSGNFTIQWSGPRMTDDMYRFLEEHQKVNHFPGSTELTRKDRMWIHLHEMAHKFGKQVFNFVPETYVLPKQLDEFLRCYQRHPNYMWIVKPHASSRGRGIFMLRDIQELSVEETMVVCRYVHNPLLIQGLKFDLRVYVLVTSFSPLRAYVYREGLTRFASKPYSTKKEHIQDLFRHLTNYSINKSAPNFVENREVAADNVGHKWSFSALTRHLRHTGVDTNLMWSRINDLVVKTLLSAEPSISRKMRDLNMKHSSCFELYGFDVLVDSKLKPWLLEVNLSPSMKADSPLDWQIKSSLLSDAFNLVGLARPSPAAVAQRALAQTGSRLAEGLARSASLDSLRQRRTWGPGAAASIPLGAVLPPDPGPPTQYDTSASGWSSEPIVLEDLSEAQLQMLAQSMHEFGRCENFLCLYPVRGAVQRYAPITEAQSRERGVREASSACHLSASQLLASVLFGPRPIHRPPSRGRRAPLAEAAEAPQLGSRGESRGYPRPTSATSSAPRPPPLPRSPREPREQTVSPASSLRTSQLLGRLPPPPRVRHKVSLKPRLPPVLPVAAYRSRSTPLLARGALAVASPGRARSPAAGSDSPKSATSEERRRGSEERLAGFATNLDEELAELTPKLCEVLKVPAAPFFVFTSVASMKDFRSIEF